MSKLRRALQAIGAVVVMLCLVCAAMAITKWLDTFIEGKLLMLFVACWIVWRVGVMAYRDLGRKP